MVGGGVRWQNTVIHFTPKFPSFTSFCQPSTQSRVQSRLGTWACQQRCSIGCYLHICKVSSWLSAAQPAHSPPYLPLFLFISPGPLEAVKSGWLNETKAAHPGAFIPLLFSCSVMSDSLQPHGLQHARLPCPSLSPGVCSNSCPLNQSSNHLILCRPLLLLPSIFPSIRVFFNESTLHIR